MYRYLSIFGIALLLLGCEKIEKGYLSDNVYYQLSPFIVQQGITTTSSSIVYNGSTAPLNVTLLKIFNKETGESADSMFLRPQSMKTFIDAVTYEDSTVEMLNAKIKDSAVAPFSINAIGGRLQFTRTSLYIDPGTYAIDVKVSNVKGTRTLNNACDLVIVPISTIDTILYKAWTMSDSAGTFYSLATQLEMDVKKIGGNDNKIIFQWKDKNGHFFNPSAGELNARNGRPVFQDWNPYYKEIRTDTSIEYEYPQGVPKLPVYTNTVIRDGSSWNDGICYYQVNRKNTDVGRFVNTVSTVQFYVTQGTYIITYYLNNVVRVP